MKTTDKHLDDAQLAAALVDMGDIPEKARQHLETCPACLARKSAWEQEMATSKEAMNAGLTRLSRFSQE